MVSGGFGLLVARVVLGSSLSSTEMLWRLGDRAPDEQQVEEGAQGPDRAEPVVRALALPELPVLALHVVRGLVRVLEGKVAGQPREELVVPEVLEGRLDPGQVSEDVVVEDGLAPLLGKLVGGGGRSEQLEEGLDETPELDEGGTEPERLVEGSPLAAAEQWPAVRARPVADPRARPARCPPSLFDRGLRRRPHPVSAHAGVSLKARYPREAARRARRRREAGAERWARWAEMVAGGMTKAEVARAEGVSRAALTMGLRKLAAGGDG